MLKRYVLIILYYSVIVDNIIVLIVKSLHFLFKVFKPINSLK